MRLYIADDNLEFSSVCEKVARREGWTVTICEDGAELLHALHQEHGPALILCDIHIPNIDGIDVAQELRFINRPLLVRFMTGGPPVDAFAAQMIGEAHKVVGGRFLYKPISIDRLREALSFDKDALERAFGI